MSENRERERQWLFQWEMRHETCDAYLHERRNLFHRPIRKIRVFGNETEVQDIGRMLQLQTVAIFVHCRCGVSAVTRDPKHNTHTHTHIYIYQGHTRTSKTQISSLRNQQPEIKKRTYWTLTCQTRQRQSSTSYDVSLHGGRRRRDEEKRKRKEEKEEKEEKWQEWGWLDTKMAFFRSFCLSVCLSDVVLGLSIKYRYQFTEQDTKTKSRDKDKQNDRDKDKHEDKDRDTKTIQKTRALP